MEHSKHPSSPLMFMHPATQRPYSPQMVRRMHNEIIKEAGLTISDSCGSPPHLCRPISAERHGYQGTGADVGTLPPAITRQEL